MSIIAALVPGPQRLQRLHAAVRDGHTIVTCDTMPELLAVCTRDPVHVAVLDLDAAGAPSFDLMRELRREAPRVALVAYVTLTPERIRHIFDAGRYGFDELVVADVDDTPSRFARAIEKAGARGVGNLVRALLPPALDPIARDAVLVSITRAHEAPTPPALARILGVPLHIVRRSLAAAGLPAPHRLVVWARLLVAAALLDETHRSADRIALALRFPSGSAFRNCCRRYLDATPSEIRTRGGARWVLAHFVPGRSPTTVSRTGETPPPSPGMTAPSVFASQLAAPR